MHILILTIFCGESISGFPTWYTGNMFFSGTRLWNVTRGTMVMRPVRFAYSHGERSVGLLRDSVPAALMLRTRWGIHTIGMRFPIDCLILDDRMRVQRVAQNLAPGHFLFWNPRWQNVVELPSGAIAESHTAVGDVLAFVSE